MQERLKTRPQYHRVRGSQPSQIPQTPTGQKVHFSLSLNLIFESWFNFCKKAREQYEGRVGGLRRVTRMTQQNRRKEPSRTDHWGSWDLLHVAAGFGQGKKS
ncbi:MAG: hypothetical protein ABF335_10280 [Alphaproteobacteria bacterium]